MLNLVIISAFTIIIIMLLILIQTMNEKTQ